MDKIDPYYLEIKGFPHINVETGREMYGLTVGVRYKWKKYVYLTDPTIPNLANALRLMADAIEKEINEN